QATDAAHVAFANAANVVTDAIEDERPILERRQRREDFLQGEMGAHLGWPKIPGYNAVWAEHYNKPLLPFLLIGEAKAGKVQNERESGSADAEIADELASRKPVHLVQPRNRYVV